MRYSPVVCSVALIARVLLNHLDGISALASKPTDNLHPTDPVFNSSCRLSGAVSFRRQPRPLHFLLADGPGIVKTMSRGYPLSN